MSPRIKELIIRMKITKDVMNKQLYRDPTDEELAERLDISLDELHELQTLARHPMSLDQKYGDRKDDADEMELIEDKNALNPEEICERGYLNGDIHKVIDEILTSKERQIIEMRNGIHSTKAFTLQEISSLMGITKERVRNIELKAMTKLRRDPRTEIMLDYLTCEEIDENANSEVKLARFRSNKN